MLSHAGSSVLVPSDLSSSALRPWEADFFVHGSPHINELSYPLPSGCHQQKMRVGKRVAGDSFTWCLPDRSQCGSNCILLLKTNSRNCSLTSCFQGWGSRGLHTLLATLAAVPLYDWSLHQTIFSYTLWMYHLPPRGTLANKPFNVFRTQLYS